MAYLTEIHRISKEDPYYEMLDDYCFKAKNLYNNALYHIRQYYFYCKNIEEGKSVENLDVPKLVKDRMKDYGNYISYKILDKLSKDLKNSLTEDYKSLPSASAQHVLKKLDANWKSFFNALTSYKKNSSKFLGRPRTPGYFKKDGRFLLELTNQGCKIKDGYITFPKKFKGLKLETKAENLKEVRIIPKRNYYQIDIVYEVVVKEKEDNGRYLGVDIGVTNLAAITSNFTGEHWLISGKLLKSVNQYYNKNKAKYQSLAKKLNNVYTTKRLKVLTVNRNNRVRSYLHKASKKLIDLALSYEVSVIVIGYNKGWKQEVNLGGKNNQNFVSIPFLTFIEMIEYKAALVGIKVVRVNESYTSGTSYLDKEEPVKENYNKSRRVKRGLFKSNDGRLLNADINGSYQILKKYIGDYYIKPSVLKVIKVA